MLKKPSPTFCGLLLVLEYGLSEDRRANLRTAHFKLDRAIEPASAVFNVVGSHVMICLKDDQHDAVWQRKDFTYRSNPVSCVGSIDGVSEAK